MSILPDPAGRPAAVRLVTDVPEHLWPQVSTFLSVESDEAPEARFEASLRLSQAAEDDDEAIAWLLVANYLEECHDHAV